MVTHIIITMAATLSLEHAAIVLNVLYRMFRDLTDILIPYKALYLFFIKLNASIKLISLCNRIQYINDVINVPIIRMNIGFNEQHERKNAGITAIIE